MKTKCNHCSSEYEIEKKYDGNIIECPGCKESFLVEELDNILPKKSTKEIFKKNPALVGAACCLFFAIVLNFISNFFFFLWGPLYLVVFILGIVAIVQQKPLKGIGFIVASLLLPLTICLINVFLVGVVLSDAIKKENQRNFYQAFAKSKKIQMDFFNTDPFANSSSIKKQIRKTKAKHHQGKIEQTQKKLKPINKPIIILTSPVSPKEPKVSPVLLKKESKGNNKKSIDVYSGSMKPQPVVNAPQMPRVPKVATGSLEIESKTEIDLLSDNDKDGFSKELELKYDTDPENKKSHPALARRLNLIEFRKILLPTFKEITKIGQGKYSYYEIKIGRRKYSYSQDSRNGCIIFDNVKYKIVKIEINKEHWENRKLVKNKNDKSKIFLKSVSKYPKRGRYLMNGKYSITMQVGKSVYSPVPRALIEDLNGGFKYFVHMGDIIQLSKKIKYKILKIDVKNQKVILKTKRGKKYTVTKFSGRFFNKPKHDFKQHFLSGRKASDSRIKKIIVGSKSVTFN